MPFRRVDDMAWLMIIPLHPAATERIRFRPWTLADRPAFRRMNRDRQVMEFFPSPLSAKASDALLERLMAHQTREGFGVWPLEIGVGPHEAAPAAGSNAGQAAGTGEKNYVWAGFVGLLRVRPDMPFAPAVEIGWRLLPAFWGRGYAAEAARACLDFGFRALGLEEIVAFTVPGNRRSWRLMERLGMNREPDGDFDHPALPDGHPLRRHVLYRIEARF